MVVVLSNWGAIHWLSLGLLLLIGEILIPGVFLMWWGIAALFLSGLLVLFPLSLPVAITIYAIIALILSILWWRYQSQQDHELDKLSSLNDRGHQMLNQHGVIVELNSVGDGRAKFGDTTWKIKGKNLKLGMAVRVKKVEGIILVVELIPENENKY